MHKHFFQIKGVAMDSGVAPSIVIMSTFEKEHMLNDSNLFLHEILLFRRYIDDHICARRFCRKFHQMAEHPE